MEYFYLEDEKSMSICKMVSRDTTHSEGILHHTAYVWVIKDEFKKNNGEVNDADRYFSGTVFL